jgi:GT2 family glycosyltransferase
MSQQISGPSADSIVVKNRWRDAFDGTVPEGWEPTLSVSVVIASYNTATLPLTLASLAAQDYPVDLLDVVVVDDGSEPAVELGQVVPKNLQLIRVDNGLWGRSNATDIGIKATKGDIIYWVDADMVLFSDNVRQHAKWAHFIPEAATIGHKGFVEEWDFTPEDVFREVSDGTIADRYDADALHRHWSLDIYDKTDDLNDSDGRNYSTHMGACATVTRAVYDRTFGQDTRLRLGEDTEIAYQIWQAGGVFIPVNEARTWHLGRATIQDHAVKVAWHNDVHFAQRMPIPRYRRRAKNRIWEVPLVRAVVEVTPETAHFARNCVDRILNSTESDVKVDLVGPWSQLSSERRRVLADPMNELHLVREWFRTDCRVNLVDEVPDSVFPTPYRLDLPVTVGLDSDSLRKIVKVIDTQRAGAVRFFTPGHDPADAVTIWDSAAVARARPYVTEERSLIDMVDRVWGLEWASNEFIELVDLREEDLDEKVVRVDPETTKLRLKTEKQQEQIARQKERIADLRGRVGDRPARPLWRRAGGRIKRELRAAMK